MAQLIHVSPYILVVKGSNPDSLSCEEGDNQPSTGIPSSMGQVPPFLPLSHGGWVQWVCELPIKKCLTWGIRKNEWEVTIVVKWNEGQIFRDSTLSDVEWMQLPVYIGISHKENKSVLLAPIPTPTKGAWCNARILQGDILLFSAYWFDIVVTMP